MHYYCSIHWQTKPNVSPVRKINLLIIFKYATRWEANFCWMRGKYAGQIGIYELLVKEGSNQNLPFRGKLVYLQSRYLIICLRSKVCDNDDLGCLLGSLLERRFCFFGRLCTWQFKLSLPRRFDGFRSFIARNFELLLDCGNLNCYWRGVFVVSTARKDASHSHLSVVPSFLPWPQETPTTNKEMPTANKEMPTTNIRLPTRKTSCYRGVTLP